MLEVKLKDCYDKWHNMYQELVVLHNNKEIARESDRIDKKYVILKILALTIGEI